MPGWHTLLLATIASAVLIAPRPGAAQDPVSNPFAESAAATSPSPSPPKLDIVCAPWDSACQAQQGGGGAELLARGSAVCWGRGSAAAPHLQQDAAPEDGGLQPVETSLSFQQLSAETSFVCGLTTRGSIACWGSSTPMDESDLRFQPPTEVRFGSGSNKGTAASDEALDGSEVADAPAPADSSNLADAEAAAAGLDGDAASDKAEASGLGGRLVFRKVVTGRDFACGILRNGSVACFGQMPGEALWTGPTAGNQAITPTLVGAPGLQFADLAADGDRACGVLSNGSLACFWAPWAADPHPYCGNLEEDDSLDGPDPLGAFNLTVPTPRLLADSSLNFTSAAVGDGVGACGLLTNGSIVCFCGYADVALEQPLPAKPRLMFGGAGVTNSYVMPEGYPELTFSAEPATIDASRNYTSVSIGGSGLAFHACGLTANGEALCWGLNSDLQLGSAANGANSSAAPLSVDTQLRFSNVAAGGAFTCAVVA